MFVPKDPGFRGHARRSRRSWARIHTTRSRRLLKIVGALALVLGAYHLLSRTYSHRRALREKFTPTTYPSFNHQDAASLADQRWRWEDGWVPELRQHLWDHRDGWRRLGSGAEGETLTFNGTVVKVYKSDQFPPRNCVPGEVPELRWPTEISASLLLGGLENEQDARGNEGFLPVRDYFISPATKDTPSRWHFLTPYLPSGNLINLATRLRSSSHLYTARELDTIFRPAFERLLVALHKMHTQYGLCHDDVKPGNIFVANPHDIWEGDPRVDGLWVLGDLGNVREVSHPYHSSILWTRVGNNVEDCRGNDVLRLLKVYMMFLRGSIQDVAAFDIQFLGGREPWSQLFWSVWQEVQGQRLDLVSAERVGMVSFEIDPCSPDGSSSGVGLGQGLAKSWGQFLWSFWSRETARARAVDERLRIRAADHISRRWGMVWLLGVPVGECTSR